MIALDTSVLVRYLVGTPADQAARARAVMDDGQPIGIPLVVLLETAHLLRTQHGVERRAVLDTTIELVTREDVEILGGSRTSVVGALVRVRALPGAPSADALVAATVRDGGAESLSSFDRDMAPHGVAVQEP